MSNIISQLKNAIKFALVDNVIKKRIGDQQANISDLESQIDQLVYQLYGLTEEEIKIIENSQIRSS